MEHAAQVLGIPVAADLLERWRGWFAPPVQPFRTDLMRPDVAAAAPDRRVQPTAEWQDTFFMYDGTWTWLSEAEFWALRPSHRRALLAIRRRTVRPKTMPVWPSELAAAGDEVMLRWVASGAVRPSRHDALPTDVWERAEPLLPRARALAGTFAQGSGPNCFGTVMAASGLDTADVQVGPQQFQAWVDECAEPVSGTARDNEPGIVFVWTEHGQVAHATVSVGAGWMLTKPSQSWSSPRLIMTVRDAVSSWRFRGTQLHRYRLRPR
ncbi:hypothetical protein DT076_07235 [Desertihabitans brevis]|uniref:Uncharacterized protein n=1 Tax=Desertihabitans brevis TaxID=2268447 RepID=A0A367YY24_9ACTN|nr:hypothetical protein [Desertihabitans brevis]RCK70429.1 hypothetical protein DT076_07235 [Desertihabitans brevis]